MGWFDEQIRQRKDNDQEVFEESIFRVASAVLGNQRAGLLRDERFITKEAIDDILKYYHYKPVEIPDSVRDPDEQLEFCLRPHGVMWRSVTLEEGWYSFENCDNWLQLRQRYHWRHYIFTLHNRVGSAV